jgi:hypothetical protein
MPRGLGNRRKSSARRRKFSGSAESLRHDAESSREAPRVFGNEPRVLGSRRPASTAGTHDPVSHHGLVRGLVIDAVAAIPLVQPGKDLVRLVDDHQVERRRGGERRRTALAAREFAAHQVNAGTDAAGPQQPPLFSVF